MNTYLKIALFTTAISAMYAGIAQLLPQLEAHPPATIEVGPYATVGSEDLSIAGEDVFRSQCLYCHLPAAGRCPDLANVGANATGRAAERAAATGEAYTDADYLVESVCRPGAHLVAGYTDIMPPQGGVLSPGQILAVVAYLQDQGGTSRVTGRDTALLERFGCLEPAPPTAPPATVGTPEEVFRGFACVGCHAIDGTAAVRIVGPSLHDVGARLSEGQIYEAILDPDATIAPADPPWPKGAMKATLDANGFYARMTAADYRALVAWLAAHDGKPAPVATP